MNPETLMQAVQFFSDAEVCDAYMRKIKWPDGPVTCPHCDSTNVGTIASRHKIQCRDCRKQSSYKVGTIFEDSPLPLHVWFVAMWAIANCKIPVRETRSNRHRTSRRTRT